MSNQQFVFTSKIIEEIKDRAEQGYQIPRKEKYWLSGYKEVRREGLSFQMTNFEKEEYLKCALGVDIYGDPCVDESQEIYKEGIIYFVENYIKIKDETGTYRAMQPRDYQVDTLINFVYKRFNMLMWSRQTSKTVSASIFILWYITFNKQQKVAIVANLDKTRKELISKIKEIYAEIPFFLKVGCSIWNDTDINFKDTECMVKSYTAGKTSVAGLTASVLFLDEFALVDQSVKEDFYGSVYPTIANLDGSKVIIASTPRGRELFHHLWVDANRPRGDSKKNQYHPSLVYWWQVKDKNGNPTRLRTYLRLVDSKLTENNLTVNKVLEYCKNLGLSAISKYDSGENRHEIHVDNYAEKLPEYLIEEYKNSESKNFLSDWFRKHKIELDNGDIIKLTDICEVSSWREDQINNVGQELFDREFDLMFDSADTAIFDSSTMNKLLSDKSHFETKDIEILEKRHVFCKDKLIFKEDINLTELKNKYIIKAVDVAEGMGGDYSVINIFELKLKASEGFPLRPEGLHDFFYLDQIGIFRDNYTSVDDVGELLYLLTFEVFDENKTGVVLEMNAFGQQMINTMKNLYNGYNNFGEHIFYRYKHRVDALRPEIGIKLRTENKNLYVKEYQKRLKIGDIRLHEDTTIMEVSSFGKKVTKAGNIVFQALSGNDDIAMTCVEASSVFNHNYFQDLCGSYFDKIEDSAIKDKINALLGENNNGNNGVDYTSLINVMRRNNYNNTTFNNPFNNPFSI